MSKLLYFSVNLGERVDDMPSGFGQYLKIDGKKTPVPKWYGTDDASAVEGDVDYWHMSIDTAQFKRPSDFNAVTGELNFKKWWTVEVDNNFKIPKSWLDGTTSPGVLDPANAVKVWTDTGRFYERNGYMYDPEGNRCPFTRNGLWQSLERGMHDATVFVFDQMKYEIENFNATDIADRAYALMLKNDPIGAQNSKMFQEFMKTTQRVPDSDIVSGKSALGGNETFSDAQFVKTLEKGLWATQQKLATLIENFLEKNPRDVFGELTIEERYTHIDVIKHLVAGIGGSMVSVNGGWDIGARTSYEGIQVLGTGFFSSEYSRITFGSALDDVFNPTNAHRVFMGPGNDMFDFYWKSHAVKVYGGSGNDLFEGDGSSAGVTFFGETGDDIFTISSGDYLISGGKGRDMFNFLTTPDIMGTQVTVTDFSDKDNDFIMIDQYQVSGFAALLDHATESGGNTTISYLAGNDVYTTITLRGISIDELSSDMFMFLPGRHYEIGG